MLDAFAGKGFKMPGMDLFEAALVSGRWVQAVRDGRDLVLEGCHCSAGLPSWLRETLAGSDGAGLDVLIRARRGEEPFRGADIVEAFTFVRSRRRNRGA
jgi:hypothetical protein